MTIILAFRVGAAGGEARRRVVREAVDIKCVNNSIKMSFVNANGPMMKKSAIVARRARIPLGEQ